MKKHLAIAFFPLWLSTPAWGGNAQWKDRSCLIDQPTFSKIVSASLGTEAYRSKASYGISFIDLKSGEASCESFFSADRPTYPASSIKTLIAVSILEKIDAGELKLTDEESISQPNAAEECSDWGCEKYGPDKKRTILQLLEDMIIVSNNIATNQLIDVATKPALKRTAASLGAPSLILVHKLYSSVNPEPNNPEHNSATARGMVALYKEIASGKRGVLKDSSRNLLISILGRQKYNNRFNVHFPTDLKFHHKTGTTSQSTSDGGFFYWSGGRAVILVGIQDFADILPLQKTGDGILKTLSPRKAR